MPSSPTSTNLQNDLQLFLGVNSRMMKAPPHHFTAFQAPLPEELAGFDLIPLASEWPARPTPQNTLNRARRRFLFSTTLPEDHDFRNRVNEEDGTLIPLQPAGRTRTASVDKPLQPKGKRDKKAASYILELKRLRALWNGDWQNEEDRACWDRVRPTIEAKFETHRLVDKPTQRGWTTKKEKKRRRSRSSFETPVVDSSSKRLCKRDESPGPENGGAMLQQPTLPPIPFPSPSEVLAVIPQGGIPTKCLLDHFWKSDGYNTERFARVLDSISVWDTEKRLLFRKRDPASSLGARDQDSGTEQRFGAGNNRTACAQNMPIDPALLNLCQRN